MQRHQKGIREAIQEGEGDLKAQLHHIAAWLINQPPLDIVRLTNSDFPAIPPEDAARLSFLAHDSTLMPIMLVLEAAQARGEIDHPHLGNIAGGIFSAIEGLHSIPDEYVIESRQAMADELIDIFIRGLTPD